MIVPGDVNNDKLTVDIRDAILAASAFGASSGDLRWNPAADIDGNNLVDIFDFILIAANFGRTSWRTLSQPVIKHHIENNHVFMLQKQRPYTKASPRITD
jgi:hypothetical protein